LRQNLDKKQSLDKQINSNVNKKFLPKNPSEKILPKHFSKKISPNKFLQKTSSKKMPPKKSSRKIPKKFQKKFQKIQNIFLKNSKKSNSLHRT
jgi:hypothetical protein